MNGNGSKELIDQLRQSLSLEKTAILSGNIEACADIHLARDLLSQELKMIENTSEFNELRHLIEQNLALLNSALTGTRKAIGRIKKQGDRIGTYTPSGRKNMLDGGGSYTIRKFV